MINCRVLSTIFILLISSAVQSLRAEEALAKITVDAGKHTRIDTPVSVSLDILSGYLSKTEFQLEEIKDSRRHLVPSQVELGNPARLWWLLSGKTEAGSKRIYEIITDASTAEDPSAFSRALENGRLANEGFRRCNDFVKGWLRHADPATGLIPRNLSKDTDIWNAADSAADNYPFMVLTAAVTDRPLFETRMLDMLKTENKLTCRIGTLPDTYSFSKQDFRDAQPDMDSIMFGASEYIKDGLMPLTEWLGKSHWCERMIEMLDDMWLHAPIETPYGKIVSKSHEVNGEMLQVLSRIYWMTGDEKYLQWAVRLGDYYLLDKHHPTRDETKLRLRDHGCEIVSGLCELYATVHFAMPQKKQAYQKPIHEMLDRILEVGRNSDGLFYNTINPQTGEHSEGIADTWGYTFNGFYTVYLIDKTQAYRRAVVRALGALNENYRNYDWENGSADGFADSIESALNLYNRQPIRSAAQWLDSETKVMWSMQKNDGIIEGWHGDGNFARTTIMYCLWKTKGLTIQPWRKDVTFGAVLEDGALKISLQADKDWKGKILFDTPRHRTNMNMPLDWSRINQFPEWFTAEPEKQYVLGNLTDNSRAVYTGKQLQQGITLNLQAGTKHHLQVQEQSFKELTGDGAWCWFADPRAVYYEGIHKRTYVGWVNNPGDIKIAQYDHKTKKTTTETLKENLEYDDHANPAILILSDGRLMVFYSPHCGRPMAYRISKNPEDISSWSDPVEIGTNTEGKFGYTYPNPIQLKKEQNKIYLFWRGGNFKPTFAVSNDTINWTPAKTLIEGKGARPYTKFASNGTDKIHFAFTDGHPRNESKNSIYYACYYDGALHKADGTVIKDMNSLPIKPHEADKVYDADTSGARAWIWDIAIDNSGNPVIVYTSLPEEKEHHYRYAKYSGGKWQDSPLTSAGSWFPQTPEGKIETETYYSGGITLDHSNPSVVYLSKPTNGVFEIEKWVTTDGGSTWTSEKMTSGSAKNNVRPVVPRGSKTDNAGLIWMCGDYIHYTKYHTALKMLTGSTKAKPSASTVEVIKNDSFLQIKTGGSNVLRYNHALMPPPPGENPLYVRSGFIHPLWSPKGAVLTGIHPEDHIHHMGIWMPWTKTKFEGRDVDFWNLNQAQGTVRFVKFTDIQSGSVFGAFTTMHEHVDLSALGGEKVALNEQWLVRVYNLGGKRKDYWLWDFVSTQRCATESPLYQIKYRYGGLGFRGPAQWVDENGKYLTSEGKTRKDGHATRGRWCDMSGPDGKKWAGLTIMSHPKNLHHPEPLRIWPNGGVFFNFAPSQLNDWTMEPGNDYIFRYRFYVHEDQISVPDAERIWRDFAEPPKIKLEMNQP
jgi:hypothetical protein